MIRPIPILWYCKIKGNQLKKRIEMFLRNHRFMMIVTLAIVKFVCILELDLELFHSQLDFVPA